VGREGVRAISTHQEGTALYAEALSAEQGFAGDFKGFVQITGNLAVMGRVSANEYWTFTKSSIQIDHPLDPANKYLTHSSVQSPEMKNVYDGNVVLDDKGEAKVALPDWFEALNKDFRYQLTAIGGPGANLHIAQKISNSRFHIGGGSPGLEVSWQVTGIRQDAWAKAHPAVVEEEKPEAELGKYLAPEVYGQPKEMGIHYRPENEMLAGTASKVR
jgi:hypothetical protein